MLLCNMGLRQTDSADKTEADDIVELNDTAYNHYRLMLVPQGTDLSVPVSVLTVPESDADQDMQEVLQANDEDGSHEDIVLRVEGLATLVSHYRLNSELADRYEFYQSDLEELNNSKVGGDGYPYAVIWANKVQAVPNEYDHGMTTFSASDCVLITTQAQTRAGELRDFRNNQIRFNGYDLGDARPIEENTERVPAHKVQIHGKDLQTSLKQDDVEGPGMLIHGSAVGVIGFYEGQGASNKGEVTQRIVLTEFFKYYERPLKLKQGRVNKATNQTIDMRKAEGALSDRQKAAAVKNKERAAKAAAALAEASNSSQDLEDNDYV